MPEAEKVFVIVNPAAGRGRGGRMLPQIRRAFGAVGVTDIRVTSTGGDEGLLAAEAIADGCSTLVVAGGDGTTRHVADAIVKSGQGTRLGVIAAGTGNDFAKVVGTARSSMEEVAQLAITPGDTAIDVGVVEEQVFVNSCGFGFDVAVLEALARTRWLRGNSLYVYSAFTQLFRYGGFQVSVASDGETEDVTLHMLLVIANSPRFGGTFVIAPGASLTDGELDAVSIVNVAALRRITLLAAAARGAHIGQRECVARRSRAYTLSFDSPPAYQIDGELNLAQSQRLSVACLPRALRVVAAPSVSAALARSLSDRIPTPQQAESP